MEGLSELEWTVLNKLLEGDHPVLVALRSQAAKARLASRENTGVGFFCHFDVPPGAGMLTTPRDFELGDVDAVMGGLEHGAGFLLFVRGGRLDFLEGFTYDEPWPKEIRDFKLSYRKEPREFDLPEASTS